MPAIISAGRWGTAGSSGKPPASARREIRSCPNTATSALDLCQDLFSSLGAFRGESKRRPLAGSGRASRVYSLTLALLSLKNIQRELFGPIFTWIFNLCSLGPPAIRKYQQREEQPATVGWESDAGVLDAMTRPSFHTIWWLTVKTVLNCGFLWCHKQRGDKICSKHWFVRQPDSQPVSEKQNQIYI